jgi:WXG100 family type VII secretion target
MAVQVSKQEESLTRAARVVSTAQDDFTAELARLRDQLSGVGASWIGSGADAFVAVMAGWDTQTLRLVTALETFEERLVATERAYDATDDEQSRLYRHILAAL